MMNTVGFIGGYDKLDLVLYVAKILETAKSKVLVVDATVNQKSRYIVPSMNHTSKYITTFEDIDVAVGFIGFSDLYEYLNIPSAQELEYDFILVDTDNIRGFRGFGLETIRKKLFCHII